MAHPLPLAHVAAEPWFQELRAMKALAGADLRGRYHPVRTLHQACIEVWKGRKLQEIRAKKLLDFGTAGGNV